MRIVGWLCQDVKMPLWWVFVAFVCAVSVVIHVLLGWLM